MNCCHRCACANMINCCSISVCGCTFRCTCAETPVCRPMLFVCVCVCVCVTNVAPLHVCSFTCMCVCICGCVLVCSSAVGEQKRCLLPCASTVLYRPQEPS